MATREAHRWRRERHTDGDARAVRQAGVEDRRSLGVEPQRPRDMDRGPVEDVRRELGSSDGPKPFARALDPHIAGPVYHQLGDVHVVKDVRQAGKERLQVVHPDAHIWPASRARQYGRSCGR